MNFINRTKLNNMKSLESWNLKQFYQYVQIEWEAGKQDSVQIIWDKIIKREELEDSYDITEETEYSIHDIDKKLKSKDLNFTVMVEHMPIFGLITRFPLCKAKWTALHIYTHTQATPE